jgi:hypothetical protein
MELHHDSDDTKSRLIVEYRTEFEEISPQWLYSYQEALDLANELYAIQRSVTSRKSAELTLFQGHVTQRFGFSSGCLSLFLQIYPENTVRATRRMQTVVLTGEGDIGFCPF